MNANSFRSNTVTKLIVFLINHYFKVVFNVKKSNKLNKIIRQIYLYFCHNVGVGGVHPNHYASELFTNKKVHKLL